MNILILSWRGPGHPQAGGAEQATLAHATGWVKAGHVVTLFTSSFVTSKHSGIINGVRVIRYGDQFIGVRLAALFWYWFAKHPAIDLVVDEFHGIPFFTPVWVFRSKILAFIHEIAGPVWHLNTWPKPFNLIPAIIGKIGEPLVFKWLYQNTPFMTVSESTKKDLELFEVKKITVVHNGVTLPKKLPKAAKEKVFTVIYLSAIAKDKGIEDAIKVFNILKTQIKNIQFWVVGKGIPSYVSYLQNLCPEAKFWGYVTDTQKFKLLLRAHVMLNPSVHEGWGLVNIEANAMGIPVVGYEVSGVKDSVINSKTGILVKEGNLGELAIALEVIKSTKNWKHFCKGWAENFTWEKSTNASNQLLQQIFLK
jgi:glycosyltransferase involved in cell wall biosynthesis